MTRLVLVLVAIAALGTAVAVSRPKPPAADGPGSPLQIATAEKNPWTSLKLNNNPEQFQFAIVSDRTGGHRAKIFSRAVRQINLLQPEFVMSVGDLIEGYSKDQDKVVKQWDEFDSYTKKFDMPFFYVPGNHDLTNQAQIDLWGGRYGKTYYHFVYRNTLFMAVNSEDGKPSVVTPEQVTAIKKALDENKDVRWTMLFVHKPLWAQKDLESNGWAGVEKALEGRKYTVFCGHVHKYQKYVRNGMNYYQLATTGGGSKLRGVRYGEFDHITWVTMKSDGPLLANVMLEGILPENLQVPDSDETGTPVKKLPTIPVRGTVTLDGKPLAGVNVVFTQAEPAAGARAISADGLTDDSGNFELTTYAKFDGVPEGKFKVTIVKSPRSEGNKSSVPEKYGKVAMTPLVVEVRSGSAPLAFELTSK